VLKTMKKPVIYAFLITATVFLIVEYQYPDDKFEAELERVIDGDTIEVTVNGRTESVRFIGMDTPEIHSENEPEHFQGVPETEQGEECLKKWAEKSTEYVEKRLDTEKVKLEHEGDRRDQYGRLRAHIHLPDTENSLNYELVEKGYANVFPVEFNEREKFEDAEQKAITEKKGLWACRS